MLITRRTYRKNFLAAALSRRQQQRTEAAHRLPPLALAHQPDATPPLPAEPALSRRDLAKLFDVLGSWSAAASSPLFTPEAVRAGEERWTPLLRERLRVQRRGKAGRSWYLEETDLKVPGRWCSPDRAIDRAGHWVASLRSATREPP